LPIAALAAAALFVAASAGAQPTPLPGLRGPALVVTDSNGVPHVCSGRTDDTFFLQGYLHARDRFFQMDVLRRTWSGTLAELTGETALAQDVQFRTFGLRRAAEESLAAHQELAASAGSLSVDVLEAYAAGVNLYLETHPLPPEYAALELTAAPPWTALDSLAIAKGIAFGHSFDLADVERTRGLAAYAAAGQARGFDGEALFFADVHRSAPFDPTTTVPPPEGAGEPPAPARPAITAPDPRAAALAGLYAGRISRLPALAWTLDGPPSAAGGSLWVLDGGRAAGGHPLLANDPHLALGVPAALYEVHLMVASSPTCGLPLDAGGALRALRMVPDGGAGRPVAATDGTSVGGGGDGGDLDAAGVGWPGVPGLVQGCNARLCWGSTVNPMDVTDVYLEELAVDGPSGLPTHTIWAGGQEPLVAVPQSYWVNRPGNGLPNDLAAAPRDPLAGGLTLIVPRRNRGPLVAVDLATQPATALSVQYAGSRATLELEALLHWLRAESLSDFIAELQFFDLGSQSFAYADVDGNVAYFTGGELPLREDLQQLGAADGGVPPFLIRDGTHARRHEWLPVEHPQPRQALAYEILPAAEMPQAINPPAGWVVAAGNDPIGATLDNDPLDQTRPGGGVFYLNPGYPSLRAGRLRRAIEALLAGGHRATAEEVMELQADDRLLDAELIAPFLLDAFARAAAPGAPAALQALAADPRIAEAASRLAGWGHATPSGIAAGYDRGDDPASPPPPTPAEVAASVAATLFAVWRGEAIAGIVDGTLEGLGLGDFLPAGDLAYAALAHLLATFEAGQGFGASGVDFLAAAPAGLDRGEKRDVLLLSGLGRALDRLAGEEFAPAFGRSTDQDDYRWGYLHRVEFEHPLGGPFNVPPAGGRQHVSPLLRGLARAGGYQTVDGGGHGARASGPDAFTFGAGAARRFVGTLDPAGIEAVQILPGGQSGVAGAPHFADQLGRWLTGGYHPVLVAPAAVAADAAAVERFAPPGQGTGGPCVPDDVTLCLLGGRFRARVAWTTPQGDQGEGHPVPGVGTPKSGLFSFFAPDNWELLVKLLDGCTVNDRYWVFVAGTTNVGWALTIEDTVAGRTWTGSNPVGERSAAIADAAAFDTCP
jgi:penicillin amidase